MSIGRQSLNARTISSERGAVALLTTVIIGILLSIITTGLVALMVAELRQSEDAEQSVRAYYAAESGVEAALDKIKAGLRSDQLCGSAASQNTNLDPANPGAVGWTCQQIAFSGSPSGRLPLPDQATQIDVGQANFRSVILEWDTSTPPFSANYFNAPANFPAGNAWPYAAPVELSVVEYPSGAFNAGSGGVVLRNNLVIPRRAGSYIYDYRSALGNNPRTGRCSAAGTSYHCQVIFDHFDPNLSYLFRLRTRYVGTNYRMTFKSANGGGGNVVSVPDGGATIDVTAKAGDAFRRVVYKVPLANGALSGLNFVIYSDNDVCKNFQVIGSPVNDIIPGCPY